MKTIKVDYLARVEGEGAVRIRFRGDEVRDVAVRIFEPPRFFEAFLRGRSYAEVPDITARICGICPVAYQMSSCAAMEDALGIEVGPTIAALRRLLYCGEWIESHALHMFFLHAPDFLGYPDAIAMAREHREIVLAALAIKKAGNAIIGIVGGREDHPINPRVGGFHSLPPRSTMRGLIPELERARQAALQALEWLGRLNYPDYECDYEFVAVDAGAEYPFIGKRVISNRGLDISVRDYDGHFEERQVPHSNALHSRLKERGAYLCGPLAHRPAPPGRRRRRAGRLARIIGIGQQWAGDDGVGLAVMAPKKH
jgi:sulfhydrogenase subunit alpha